MKLTINEKLTSKQLKRREEIAKDLPDEEFKKRYGDDWMSVKMGTATNIAKNEEVSMNEKKKLLLGRIKSSKNRAKKLAREQYVHIAKSKLNLTEQVLFNLPIEELEALGFNIKKHPYDHAVVIDRVGNISPKGDLVQMTGWPGWPSGTWGPDFHKQGFGYEKIGRQLPILVTPTVKRKLDSLKSRNVNNFVLVFSIPANTKNMSRKFRNGEGVVFKYKGSNFAKDATEFSIKLLNQGFTNLKWDYKLLPTPSIVAEYVGSGFTLKLGSTNSSFSEGPVWNLHKEKIGGKHRLFYRSDVMYPTSESSGYSVSASGKPNKQVTSIGAFGTKSVGNRGRELYGDDEAVGRSGSYAQYAIDLSMKSDSEIQSNGILNRQIKDTDITVRDVFLAHGIEAARKREVIIVKDEGPRIDSREVKDTFRIDDDDLVPASGSSTSVGTGASTPATQTPTSQPASTPSRQPNIDEDDVLKAQAAASGLVATWITTKWQDLQKALGSRLNTQTNKALENASKNIRELLDPTSPKGAALRTWIQANQSTLTMAALIGAGLGSFFFIRRYLKNKEDIRKTRMLMRDSSATRELQYAVRSAGLNRIPQKDLMLALPEIEKYELSNPRTRRLYDI